MATENGNPVTDALIKAAGLENQRVRGIWYAHASYRHAPVITAEIIVVDGEEPRIEMQEFEVVPRAAIQDVTAPAQRC